MILLCPVGDNPSGLSLGSPLGGPRFKHLDGCVIGVMANCSKISVALDFIKDHV